jgi:hypothetical protein
MIHSTTTIQGVFQINKTHNTIVKKKPRKENISALHKGQLNYALCSSSRLVS